MMGPKVKSRISHESQSRQRSWRHTAATLTLPQIRSLCDAMFRAHAKRLPPGLRG